MKRLQREAILNSMTEGMIIMNPAGKIVSVNPPARALFDVSSINEARQQLSIWGDSFEVTHFDGRPIEPGEWPMKRAIQGESFTNCEFVIRNRRRRGESWVGSFNANPVRDPSGRIFRVIVTVRDIGGWKRAEQALSECEERFRRIVDTAPVMTWRSGVDKRCTFFNREWLGFRGRTMEQELSGGWTEGVHPDDRKRLLAVYDSSFDERRPFLIEYRLRRWDGEYCWVLDQGVPQFSSDKTFAGYIGLCSDITQVRMAKQHAVTRQNIETIGLLATGIAHDFNNLLGSILAEAELALAELPAGMPAAEEIQTIKIVALRGSEIVRELMIYAGQETGNLELIDISKLTLEMVQLIRISVSKHIHIETEFAADLPAIQANAARIRQVILNLVINASEAVGASEGTIRLTTRQDGDFIQIEVADTGPGMDAKIQAVIFDPFFTTKHAGRGRGLAVVQAIVQNHGGSIQIETAPGRGTTFRILFPSARVPPTGEPVGEQAVPRPSVKASILIVEDEATMLLSVSRMLRRRGFSTLEASDGSAAVRLLQDKGNAIDVMILDMTIPGMPSREVFEEARRLRPDLNIILTSAYSEGVATSSLSQPRAEGFIRKPYQIASLEQLIERVLAK